ncbi:MAG: ABC transporter ATP-binding protein/permease [Sphaerochaetaceae bacterium]|nr:ABC transporter ATP-binding protein/permease [Sphaerochaetaceae bacterium]
MKQQKSNPIKRIWQIAEKEHGRLLLSVVYAVFGVIAGVVPFLAAARIVSGIISGNRDIRYYLILASVAFAGYALKSILYSAGLSVSHKAAFSLLAEIRKAIFAKLPRMPLGTIIDTSSGKLKQIIVDEVERLERPLAHMIPELTSNIVGALAVWVYMMAVDWRMGLICLISVPVGLFFFALIATTYGKDYRQSVEITQDMNSSIVEYVHGIEVIKAYNQGKSFYAKFRDKVMANAAFYYHWMKKTELNNALCTCIAPCTLLTVLPIGWRMYVSGSISADVFMTSIMLSMSIVGPILQAISFTDSSAKVATTVKMVDELLAGEEQEHSKAPVTLKKHSIELRNVSYCYHEGTEILHDVSLKIPEKSFTALVGPSGSGKSTIAKLIGGFWDVRQGCITMGGKDLRTIPLEQLYDQVAYVSQDIWLFDDTVMNNLRMGKTTATDDQVRAVAVASGCNDFIEALPNGYQTMVGAGGTHLSGGERQRLAIARAMLKDAPVVILDEATAYIDPENEALIQRALSRLVKDKTVIIIAHRLSTVVNADNIVLVNGGKVEATGTHEELLASSGLYSSMWHAHISEGGTR